MLQLTEELSCGSGRLRIDVHNSQSIESLFDDMTFLNYRLANVKIERNLTRNIPDIVWHQEAAEKDIQYENDVLMLHGEWEPGAFQKIVVSMLALRLEMEGFHPFHASAIRYKNRSIMFLGGESNSGKSMAQIEGSRRGGLVVSTETVVTDERGWVVDGSKNVFLRKRAKGTERADKPSQDEGIAKFFNATPEFVNYNEPCDVDIVIVPDMDGHYETSVAPLIRFEKEYQTYHCLMNYLGLHQLLAPGLVMPIIDSNALRMKRAEFCHRFCERPYYMIRSKDPQILLDNVEELLDQL